MHPCLLWLRLCLQRHCNHWNPYKLFVNHCRINAQKNFFCERVIKVLNAFIVLFYILFYLVGLAIYFSCYCVYTFTADFNVCTVWHVSGASRPLSFVNKPGCVVLVNGDVAWRLTAGANTSAGWICSGARPRGRKEAGIVECIAPWIRHLPRVPAAPADRQLLHVPWTSGLSVAARCCSVIRETTVLWRP